jgi:hypothetical protein
LDLSRNRFALRSALGALGVLFVIALGTSALAHPSYCNAFYLNHPSDPYVLALVGLGGFVAGRALGHLRVWKQPDPLDTSVSTEPWLLALLTALLVIIGLALMYESLGLAHETRWPPITAYIRCAAAGQTLLTGTTAGIVFIVLGGWLWHPANPRGDAVVTVAAGLILCLYALGIWMSTSTNHYYQTVLNQAQGYSNGGFVIVTLALFSFPLAAVISDLRLRHRRRWAIGHYVNEFATTYPWFACFFSVVIGAMIAHFFLGIVGKKAILLFFASLVGVSGG